MHNKELVSNTEEQEEEGVIYKTRGNLLKINEPNRFNNLILIFQNNSSNFTLNRVKYEKQILPSVRFKNFDDIHWTK